MAELMQKLARYSGLSDGAKITFLEFLYCFWTEDKRIPSYSELCTIRSVVRSTIQLHIEELERSGLIVSVRLPDNRKRYKMNLAVLDVVPAQIEKKSVTPVTPAKHVAKYSTSELCGYFSFLYSEKSGTKVSASRPEYNMMKVLHRRHGSSALVRAIDYFKRVHERKKTPFSLRAFLDGADELVVKSKGD